MLNPGCCPRFRWAHVLLNHRSTAPLNRHFVKSTLPRGQRAVKSALNPGYSRVKPPASPGGRGAGVSIDWCINFPNFCSESCREIFSFILRRTSFRNHNLKHADDEMSDNILFTVRSAMLFFYFAFKNLLLFRSFPRIQYSRSFLLRLVLANVFKWEHTPGAHGLLHTLISELPKVLLVPDTHTQPFILSMFISAVNL